MLAVTRGPGKTQWATKIITDSHWGVPTHNYTDTTIRGLDNSDLE